MIILETKTKKEKILKRVKEELEKRKARTTLASIQVGDNQASKSYLNQISVMCNEIGCKYQNYHFENTTEEQLISLISKLNKDSNITSILLCLPLPSCLNKDKIINSIDPLKDVDGLTDINLGKTLKGSIDALISATASGIKNILTEYHFELSKKNVLIINRSNLIGRPIASLLLDSDATVTISHSKTKNINDYLSLADIVITAVGKANFITSDRIKENAVVIDAGVSFYNGKLCGDFKITNDKNIYLCSAPNGVGNMTIASLAQNILKCYDLNQKKQ